MTSRSGLMMNNIVPIILAGGSGTRLWPLSREQYPKQFLKLTNEHSLLQEAALRAGSLDHIQSPLVLCGDKHRFIVAEQLMDIGINGATIILEPEGRNTAPAAAVAAHYVAERYGRLALMLLMPADQVIADQERFRDAVTLAAGIAALGKILTFGIKPTRPETGFGYMKTGVALGNGGWNIESFVEKPDLTRANIFIDSGDYYWNSGMYLFQSGTFLDELTQLEPQTSLGAKESLSRACRDLTFVRLNPEAFHRTRADSIDYAIMEKTCRAALVPLDAGWDDVGSWTFMDNLAKDAQGNSASGDVLLENSSNNLVHAGSRLVAIAGVTDHIVIETQDAVLVTTKNRSQDVKKLVAALKTAKRAEVLENPHVYRPWGSYEAIAAGTRFQVKRIIVKPGCKLSLQKHHHRAEHWVVVRGTALVTCGEKEFLLHEDQSTYVPLGMKHRLENPGKITLELIEVQSGPYLDEDDIVRFEDAYGRASA